MTTHHEPTVGVDNERYKNIAVVKFNVAWESRDDCQRVMAGVVSAFSEKLGIITGPVAEGSVRGKGTCIFGFSARFFSGHLSHLSSDRRERRFKGLRPRPRCVETARLKEDNFYPNVASISDIARNESDMVVVVESEEAEAIEEVIEILSEEHLRLTEVKADRGMWSQGHRNAFGYHEEVSNLQDMRVADPESYRNAIFVRDDDSHLEYAGGTYLVVRKYRLHVDRWLHPDFAYSPEPPERLTGWSARDAIVGRGRDETTASESVPPYWSHARHANPHGIATTKFGVPVRPPPYRILRRGFSVSAPSATHSHDFMFLCFQADIQRRGFEFIHNEWLLSSGLLGREDPLLSRDAGLVEPLDVCYYFVPTYNVWPGDVLFD